ncbi:MAG: aldo/keto reductase [Clostridia bacterium]|nr:aldo/keto reductase [Clostridia bacterium]
MKKLGFGLMRLPKLNAEDPASIDIEQTKQMVDSFIEQGFTYFDTAWMYCGFASERAVKEALISRHARDTFTLATKLHSGFIKEEADRDRIFNEQREKTGADFFDYYLLHAIGRESYEKYKEFHCFEWLSEKKAQGLVKHIGFSYHDDAELLDLILTEHPEVEFVQLQINYIDWENEGVQSRKCYEVATKHGKPVIVMEPVKGGTLAAVPAAAEKLMKSAEPEMSVPSWAIRFAASLPNVIMVLSGMSNMEQLIDNTSYMRDFKPLDESERTIIDKVVNILNSGNSIACTGCSYCTDGCPIKIAIPQYFSLYNADLLENGDGWTAQMEYYDNLTLTAGKASSCIECGQCEGICPQKLPIIKHLKSVAKRFEAN